MEGTKLEIDLAWESFVRGKWHQREVRDFWFILESELDRLHRDLRENRYRHGLYRTVVIQDTKRREISIPCVRDRIVHQLIAQSLREIYQPIFYQHSYSAQKEKGVYAARIYARSVIQILQSKGQVWILKMDVKRYFDSIPHAKLQQVLDRRLHDPEMSRLSKEVISSFGNGIGIPLGNLTSQWFGNIYLHELDHFVKQVLRFRYYIRYNDDIILFSINRTEITAIGEQIRVFLNEQLSLCIPKTKCSLTGLPKSADILGMMTDGRANWLRSQTKRRANQALIRAFECPTETFLDSVISYHALGVFHPLIFTI